LSFAIQNSKLLIGRSEVIGKRPNMEDVTLIHPNFRGNPDEFLCGIFDGHGGKDCSEYASKHLPPKLASSLDKTNDPIQSLKETFNLIHSEISGWSVYAGTTACVGLFLDKKFILANIGDTRCVFSSKGKTERVSVDHTIKLEEEVQRIKALGGSITDDRVQGMIAVTRSMGNSILHPYIIADAHTKEIELDVGDFIIIGCDGLWDVISDEKAVEMIKDECEVEKDAQKAADKLRKFAEENGSEDNISVLVMIYKG